MGWTAWESVALGRIVFYLATPPFMLAVLLLFELLAWQLMRVTARYTGFKVVSFYHIVRYRLSLIALSTLLCFYPAMVRSCLSAVVCVPIADATSFTYYWAGYLNQPFAVSWHATLMWTNWCSEDYPCLCGNTGCSVLEAHEELSQA